MAKHKGNRGGVIAVLEEIQAEYGYLPEAALRTAADALGRSLVDVYGVATFYRSFSLKPRGKHLVCACLGTACHVRGAQRVVEELQRQLGIAAGQTTPDKEFTLETVNCLGACALGPVVVIDGRYFPRVRQAGVRQLLAQARSGFDEIEPAEDSCAFPLEVSCPRCNHSLMDGSCLMDGHPSIRVSASFGGKRGSLRLSSLYGSCAFLAEHDVPPEAAASLTCPHCRAELTGPPECAACAAPMAPMRIAGGGMLQVCSRRGCMSRAL
ncbi:MAG TPA: NAD(P)H-dependent oxidoreductase subunit E, partial [Phycisphaerae bacterium]|nr:NAD(P)H-dependent oxidoreductase subunit E [Phycisphaerae bacterium]